mgnify:CR=1 FL=1
MLFSLEEVIETISAVGVETFDIRTITCGTGGIFARSSALTPTSWLRLSSLKAGCVPSATIKSS